MIFKIISGPLTGLVIPVWESMTLGRSKGDVLLKDPKVSNPHVQIYKSVNQFMLKDLNSKKGIIYKDKCVSFLVLQPGMSFQLGDTEIQVDEVSISQSLKMSAESFNKTNSQGDPSGVSHLDQLNAADVEENLKTNLYQQLKMLEKEYEDEVKSIHFLEKIIQLKFERGSQKNLIWEIGYLPRRIGLIDADLPLLDFHAKDICFELLFERNQITFFTPYKESVLLNYKHIQKTPLQHKDLIIVGSSYLRVFMK